MEKSTLLTNDHGRQLTNRELKEWFGIRAGKTGYRDWRSEGHPKTLIRGVLVYVKPKNVKNSCAHRAIAICPICDKHVPAGRFDQHFTVHQFTLVWLDSVGEEFAKDVIIASDEQLAVMRGEAMEPPKGACGFVPYEGIPRGKRRLPNVRRLKSLDALKTNLRDYPQQVKMF